MGLFKNMTHPPIPALEFHLHLVSSALLTTWHLWFPSLALTTTTLNFCSPSSNGNWRPWWNDNYEWVLFSIWSCSWSGNNPSQNHIFHVGFSWNSVKELHYTYVWEVNWQKHVDEIECIVLVPYNFIGGWEFMPCLFWGHSVSYYLNHGCTPKKFFFWKRSHIDWRISNYFGSLGMPQMEALLQTP
jgi:hypothetical protein